MTDLGELENTVLLKARSRSVSRGEPTANLVLTFLKQGKSLIFNIKTDIFCNFIKDKNSSNSSYNH